MPEIPNEQGHIPKKVIHEIVAFRYSDEATVMLVGEAEVVIGLLTEGEDTAEIYANIHSVRVDVLSAFDPDGCDAFASAMNDPTLKRALEEAALEHFFHPPKVPVGLPKRISEW
jgi:hypothetical protein